MRSAGSLYLVVLIVWANAVALPAGPEGATTSSTAVPATPASAEPGAAPLDCKEPKSAIEAGECGKSASPGFFEPPLFGGGAKAGSDR